MELIGSDAWTGGKKKCSVHSAPSVERPYLQLHDTEVVGFWQTAVVEGVAGAAAAKIQVLIKPQTKVTTEEETDEMGEGVSI